jgi:hypothetical protein
VPLGLFKRLLVHVLRTENSFLATSGSGYIVLLRRRKQHRCSITSSARVENSPAIENTSRNGEDERIAESFPSAIAATIIPPGDCSVSQVLCV